MAGKFKLKAISKVKSKDEARFIAMEYQSWASQHSMSWGEVAKYSDYFEALGKRFKLTKEFKENGI